MASSRPSHPGHHRDRGPGDVASGSSPQAHKFPAQARPAGSARQRFAHIHRARVFRPCDSDTVPRLLCLLFFMLHSVAARVPPLFARRRPAQMPYSDAASRWWAAGSVNFAVLPVKQ